VAKDQTSALNRTHTVMLHATVDEFPSYRISKHIINPSTLGVGYRLAPPLEPGTGLPNIWIRKHHARVTVTQCINNVSDTL